MKNEKLSQYKIKRTIFTSSILAILLVLFIVATFFRIEHNLVKAQTETLKKQLAQDTDLYINLLTDKIKFDTQVLTMLSNFKELDDFNYDKLATQLDLINKENDFVQISVFFKNGNGVRSTLNKNFENDILLSDLEYPLKESIVSAFEGRSHVSDFFYSDYIKDTVISISIPVYKDNEVIGVVNGCNSIDAYKNIIYKSMNNSNSGYVHIIDRNGNFIVSNYDKILYKDSTNIYGSSNKILNKDRVLNDLEKNKYYFTTADYNDDLYYIYIKDIGINDLSIINIDSINLSHQEIYTLLQITKFGFISIIIILISSIIYNYIIIRKSNNYLLKEIYYNKVTKAPTLRKFKEDVLSNISSLDNYILCIFNIRHFQFINTLFGTDTSDYILNKTKQYLDIIIKKGEFYCQYEHDQFVLLLKCSSSEKMIDILKSLEKNINYDMSKKNQDYKIELYAGIVDILKDSSNLKIYLEYANTALKEAKKVENKFIIFNENFYNDLKLNKYIDIHKEIALENKEFKVYLQPKFNLNTNNIIGAEALVRWITNDNKIIYPDKFIPSFEKNGFCVDLDFYMIEEVCKLINEMKKHSIELMPISINQSKLVFYQVEYISKLKSIINTYNIDPSLITLEILEEMSINDLQFFNSRIYELKKIGFKVSLDDFGTGYSSLNTLGHLDIDELKIDKSFLLEMNKSFNNRQKEIMSIIATLSKKLCMKTVVEGVESKNDVEFIKSLNFDYGQGYFYDRPIPAKDFINKYLINK